MEWMKLIGDSIQYIENHLLDDISVEDIAKHIGISSFYYQKGFSMLCGFTVAEYIRNRRLASAGNEVIGTDHTIIDIALKYGYDSPDSFTKAFTRFHGSTPTAVRKDNVMLKSFAPLKIKVHLEGGYLMDYRIEKKASLLSSPTQKHLPTKAQRKLFRSFGRSIMLLVKVRQYAENSESTLMKQWERILLNTLSQTLTEGKRFPKVLLCEQFLRLTGLFFRVGALCRLHCRM